MSKNKLQRRRLNLEKITARKESGPVRHPWKRKPKPFIYLTAKEAAALLRLSPVTLGRWRVEGTGPAFRKFGRRVVYARRDIFRWAKSQHRTSTSEAALDHE